MFAVFNPCTAIGTHAGAAAWDGQSNEGKETESEDVFHNVVLLVRGVINGKVGLARRHRHGLGYSQNSVNSDCCDHHDHGRDDHGCSVSYSALDGDCKCASCRSR